MASGLFKTGIIRMCNNDYKLTCFVEADWQTYIFEASAEPEVGQRLGIQYIKAMQPTIAVMIGDAEYQFHQESMGLMAISGVVWDAGLLLVDFLQEVQNATATFGRVLDVGCGTGIAGISALLMGATYVQFTDIAKLDCFDLNIELLPDGLQQKQCFLPYTWSIENLPPQFLRDEGDVSEASLDRSIVWDTVLCSDLLYEEKCHSLLISVLRRLKFKRLVFSYKKRHDVPERLFFESLNEWCTIRVVEPGCIPLRNLPAKSLAGLYIVIVEQKLK